MKFAKTLKEVAVPEWQDQYVDYKIGKKKIKRTTAALRNASTTPALQNLRRTASRAQAQVAGAGRSDLPSFSPGSARGVEESPVVRRLSAVFGKPSFAGRARSGSEIGRNSPHISPNSVLENSPLQQADFARSPGTYGTMGNSPNTGGSGGKQKADLRAPSFSLPDPMQPIPQDPMKLPREAASENAIVDDDDDEISLAQIQPIRTNRRSSRASTQRPASGTGTANSRFQKPFLHRVLTLGKTPVTVSTETSLTIPEVQAKAEKEFLTWLLDELNKCEKFYMEKEKHAVERYRLMHEQLEVMRDRWYRDKHQTAFEDDNAEMDEDGDSDRNGQAASSGNSSSMETVNNGSISSAAPTKKRPSWKTMAETINGYSRFYSTQKVEFNGDADSDDTLNSSGKPFPSRDYERRKRPGRNPVNDPPHRMAKRKLKKAYIEYFHGLEMLKSYIQINREAFRKITKKFDKASGIRTSTKFMTEYVDRSHFGGPNNKLDDLMNDTENLFARFFERGNRKEASARLRSRENKTMHHASMLRSGFALGAAVVLAAYALARDVERLNDDNNPEWATRTGYLLQIWGGVALILAQSLLFAINVKVWAQNKINYAFIFEFDGRHMMNYRQFLEMPALMSLLFAVCFWFGAYAPDFWDGAPNDTHWPIIYVILAALFLFNPFNVAYLHSRKWFLRVLFRLFFSGFFPVEFKDFWMGDMFCSMTYALGNISLYFCLYSREWNTPSQCNSSHSRLMGFFTALPGIWRLLQCLRRYHDSRAWFPHLANGGKYTCTILHYLTLSLWRIDTRTSTKAAFIICASINSIYTTVWDIAMDWSLGNPYSKYPLLRDNLGFHKQPWAYYFAMVLDPIIRCDWFLYFVFANRIQHSALLSFCLALAEVFRRFIWAFFRMENEHNTNVGANRAYREMPLPYRFPTAPISSPGAHPILPIPEDTVTPTTHLAPSRTYSTGARPATSGFEADVEGGAQPPHRRPSMGRIPASPVVRTIERVGRTMTNAHLQDYERRRVREAKKDDDDGDDGDEESASGTVEGYSSDEEDEGEDYYQRTAEVQRGKTKC